MDINFIRTMLLLGGLASFFIFSMYSFNSVFTGQSYSYALTDPNFRAKLQSSHQITQVEIYSSPIGQTPFQHHEIMFQLHGLLWLLASFGVDGLQTQIHLDKNMLIDRRPNNSLIAQEKVNASTKRVRDFLIKHEDFEYNLLTWNSHHFSKALWDTIVK